MATITKNLERYAIREAAEVHFYDLQGKFITSLDTLKNSNITNDSETVYAKGGRGNTKLIGFTGSRDSTLEIQDALFTTDSWDLLLGNRPVKKKRNVRWYETKQIENNEIVLDKYPVKYPSGKEKVEYVFKLNSTGATDKKFEIMFEGDVQQGQCVVDNNILTFHDSDVEKNDWIRVYYKIETDDETKTIKMIANDRDKTYKIECDVLVRDFHTKEDFEGKFIVSNGKLELDNEISFSPEGDPSVQNLRIECLKPALDKDLWKLIIFNEKYSGLHPSVRIYGEDLRYCGDFYTSEVDRL